MKRITAIMLLIAFVITLCCCDDNKNNTSKNSKPNKNNNATTNQSENSCTHLWGQWVEKEKATCQAKGIKERTCHSCNKIETQNIDIIEHTAGAWVIDKVAEVGKEGHKYTKCVYCDKVMDEQRIPAIADNHQHAILEWLTTKKPDCTNNGTESAICSCGKTINTKTIPAIGHKTVVDKAVNPTCTTNGLTEGSHCSVCSTILVKQNIVSSTGHNMSSKKVAATDNKPQHTIHYCTKCSYSYEEIPTPISLINFKSNNDGTCSVLGLNDKTIKNLVIPEKSPSGDTVVSINHEAFKGYTSMETVVIPSTVTYIGYGAFEACSNLRSVTFPINGQDNLILNYRSFAFSGIQELDLSETTIESIGEDAFYGCDKLKTVKLNDVKTIERFAFSQCKSLVSVIHSGKLTTIGERSFEGCQKLTVLRSEHSQHNLDTILNFSYHAFTNSAIRDIVINKDVIAINDAFVSCINLGTVDFSQVNNKLACFDGSKIEKLILPSSMTTISQGTFSYVMIDSLVIPDTVTEIRSRSFKGANIGKLTFGAGLKTIGDEAFEDADIDYDFSRVTAPLSIGREAFAYNEFTSFAFPKSTVYIENSALKGCNNLKTLSIPFIGKNKNGEGVSTHCLAWLFDESIDCWKQEKTIPKSLKTLMIYGENPGTRSFMNLQIENIVVGKEITSIGHENFDSSTALKRVYYEGTEQEWQNVNLRTSTNTKLLTAEKYFYSDTKPTTSGKFWHFGTNGEILVW